MTFYQLYNIIKTAQPREHYQQREFLQRKGVSVMKTKDVSKFNFWASKPKGTQSTRTIQDVASKKVIRQADVAAICYGGGCTDC